MLRNSLSLSFALTLASAGVVGLTAGTASAAPLCLPNACATGHRTIPGGGGGTGGGGDGGGGGTGPGIGCPTVGGRITCAPGAAPAAVQPYPTQEVVDTAFAALPKPPPTIHTTPDPRTYVQIRTGLWVDPANTADQHATASVDGQTVTVTASQAQVVWNLGEGGTVTCLDAGTPGGTSCGYTYQRSSAHLSSAARPGVYDISAKVTWHVSWVCTGPCNPANGEMAKRVESLPTRGTLAVGEVQTETGPG